MEAATTAENAADTQLLNTKTTGKTAQKHSWTVPKHNQKTTPTRHKSSLHSPQHNHIPAAQNNSYIKHFVVPPHKVSSFSQGWGFKHTLTASIDDKKKSQNDANS
jgi:hypothetical protein